MPRRQVEQRDTASRDVRRRGNMDTPEGCGRDTARRETTMTDREASRPARPGDRQLQHPTRRQLGAMTAGAAALLAACGQASAPSGGAAAQGAGSRKALPPAKIAFLSNWGAQHQVTGQQ